MNESAPPDLSPTAQVAPPRGFFFRLRLGILILVLVAVLGGIASQLNFNRELEKEGMAFLSAVQEQKKESEGFIKRADLRTLDESLRVTIDEEERRQILVIPEREDYIDPGQVIEVTFENGEEKRVITFGNFDSPHVYLSRDKKTFFVTDERECSREETGDSYRVNNTNTITRIDIQSGQKLQRFNCDFLLKMSEESKPDFKARRLSGPINPEGKVTSESPNKRYIVLGGPSYGLGPGEDQVTALVDLEGQSSWNIQRVDFERQREVAEFVGWSKEQGKAFLFYIDVDLAEGEYVEVDLRAGSWREVAGEFVALNTEVLSPSVPDYFSEVYQ